MRGKTITLLAVTLSLLFILLSGCNGNVSLNGGQTFEVKRGDLDVIVSSDGSLDMPNVFNLSFGTMGTVQDILVQEGDRVKQGAMLAFLDNTAQINAIKTALYNIRSAANALSTGKTATANYYGTSGNIVATMSVCGPFDFPNNYPELSAPQIFEEAQKDLDEFISYYNQGQYKDAGYKLGMVYFDVEVCEALIQSRPDAAVYAGVKSQSNAIYYPDGTAGTTTDISESDQKAIDFLKQYRDGLLAISQLMMRGDYEKVTPELDKAQQDAVKGFQLVENTVHHRGRDYLTYPDTPTSLNFLQSSLRLLQELDKYTAQDDAKPEEIAKKIYLAKLSLLMSRDTLANQTLIYDLNSGFNWKSLQQYNLAVQSAEIALDKAKQDIMNTVIIAPSDGTVVSVNLKKDYVLSAQDYSSRSAIQLVDTKTIEFTGLVDEIDIMKVQTGQKAKITVDAVPDKVLTGTVKFISPFGTQSGNVIKFAVTIELDPTDVELRGSLSATADINTYSAKNVLLVPTTAIITTPRGPMVTVINEATGQPEPRKVTLGKQNFQYAEVLQGLKEGEKVSVSNQPNVNTGQSSRPLTQGGTMRMLR